MAMYHPLEDVNHCVFRMMLLTRDLVAEPTLETFRLMDFYCLFPSALSEIRLPRQYSKYKPVFKAVPPPYELLPNNAALFDKLRHIQNNALGCLVSLGFFDRARFLDGVVAPTEQPVPVKIQEKITASPVLIEEWFGFLTKAMPLFPADGPDGWKARTQLDEFRYDAK